MGQARNNHSELGILRSERQMLHFPLSYWTVLVETLDILLKMDFSKKAWN